MWRVDWIAWRAADILDQIRPYLILKADQADLALELHAIRAGRGTGNNPRKGLVTRTPETTIARMNEIREQLMRLKKV